MQMKVDEITEQKMAKLYELVKKNPGVINVPRLAKKIHVSDTTLKSYIRRLAIRQHVTITRNKKNNYIVDLP